MRMRYKFIVHRRVECLEILNLLLGITHNHYDNMQWPKSLKINLMLTGKCYRLLLSRVIPASNLGLSNFSDKLDTAYNRKTYNIIYIIRVIYKHIYIYTHE